MRPRSMAVLAALLLFPLAPRAAHAQCADWAAMPFGQASGPVGVNNGVSAICTWDPDGAGPRPEMLVIGGSFTSVQGVPANRVAARDPVTGKWEAIGGGFGDNTVRALCVYNGELYAGGTFTMVEGNLNRYLARWNGSSWQSVGTVGAEIHALTIYNGELVAAGYFTQIGGVIASRIARWNGSAWNTLGSGLNDWTVCLQNWNGELVAGGWFTNAGGVAANRIARWNGSTWSALGAGTNAEVLCLGVFSSGLIAGGRFTTAGGVSAIRVARWSGSSWSALGSGLDGPPQGFSNYNGELICTGGFFQAGGVDVAYIARWNGAAWNALDFGLIGGGSCAYPYAGELIVGGGFTEAGAMIANSLARWNGFNWGSFGGGGANSVSSMTTFLGRVVAGGDLSQSTLLGPQGHRLVGWDGASFSAFGFGMNAPVLALMSHKYSGVFGSYELVAGGSFSRAGSVTANRIARWNVDPFIAFPPPAWEPMGAGFNGNVLAIERHAGATYAGGAFTGGIARWNETTDTWEPMGSGMNAAVFALRSFNGSLYAGGSFTTAGGVATGGLARWDGSAWQQVGGNFLGIVFALEVHNNQLVMAGRFPGINSSPNLAQWNGSTYTTFGFGGGTNDDIRALESTGSRLYIGGEFTTAGGVPAQYVAYYDGSWHELDGGANSYVYSLLSFNGELHVGGAFSQVNANTVQSWRWAKYSATGLPWIAQQPFGQTAQPGQSVSFTSTLAQGYPGVTLRWHRFGVPLSDGPTGTGSSITGATTTTLTLSNVSHTDFGDYHLLVSSGCGSVNSSIAKLSFTPGSVGVDDLEGAPARFVGLGPNPARDVSRLAFALARESEVRFAVHDVAGRRVRDLLLGRMPAGSHQAEWDGRDGEGRSVGAGLYLVSMEVDGRRLGVRRLTVLR